MCREQVSQNPGALHLWMPASMPPNTAHVMDVNMNVSFCVDAGLSNLPMGVYPSGERNVQHQQQRRWRFGPIWSAALQADDAAAIWSAWCVVCRSVKVWNPVWFFKLLFTPLHTLTSSLLMFKLLSCIMPGHAVMLVRRACDTPHTFTPTLLLLRTSTLSSRWSTRPSGDAGASM